ncbi:hypothetical protein [Rhodococcus opacus]|uniref:hypothetical protein n=1 Tax=Rhodococcus opacus TaxID=37919 RepID=UPI002953A497|nr:hypothetical protein [Rhodococcus opacus]MDV7090639.1 hypothetical protein [Rhodococcus opacus]
MSGPASISGRVKPCWAQMAVAGAQRREVGLPAHVEISYKSVNDALRRLMKACRSPRHSEWDERAVAQAMLDATLWGHLPTGAVSLDSTDISTWARVRHRKPLVDADPDSPPPPDHPLAPPDPAHPHARRRGHHLPDAPTGPDGRYIYTIDMDARMGWRSSEFEATIFFCGYDLHVITDVPSAPGRGPVVHVARAMNLSPAGSHKGISGLPAVHALGDMIGKPRQLITDRAYNYVTNDTFALPVWQLGYTTIYDLHPKQRGTHPGPDGSDTLWIDGVLYPTSLPAGLHDIEPIDTKMDVGVRGRLDRRHQARQAYVFVPHGARQPDGSRRYRGPAVPPARVRCPNNPVSMCAPHSVPTTFCTPGTPCGCGCTITLDDADYPDLRMPFQHGTLAWGASYHRRVGIESLFADLKRNRLGVHRGYFRGFGIRRYTLLAGFTLAALNILNLHDWATRREVLDSWGRFLGEPEPERRPRRRRHPLRHAPRNISGCHGTGQIATPPRQRNPRIPVVDLDHPPKMTHYRARFRQICCSHSSNVLHTDRRSGRRSVECAEIRVRIGSRV